MSHAPSLDSALVCAPRRRENGRLLRRLRRVSQMPLVEMAARGRQEAAKLFDRATVDRAHDADVLLKKHAPVLADHARALEVLRDLAPLRFFPGAVDPSLVARVLPAYRDQIVSSAAMTMQGCFDLLGYRNLWFGEPIDWHLDPVRQRRAPRVHWTQIDPLDASTVGDSKVVWELNRHQWIARLAAAYAFTGDERYAERALAAIESWIVMNPYGIGINWCSSLEAAYRVMSWTWTLVLLRHSTALSDRRLVGILGSLWLHATYVARYLSYYFSPNTHLTGEALGLFYAGTVFPEFRGAASWREIGAHILISEARTQICADGVHFERSTCYHRYTVETYQQFLLLAERNHIPVPPELHDSLRRMVEFLLAMRRPDGALPEIGDADGGRLLPLVERGQCDPRGALAVAAAMFRRGDLVWAAEEMAPDVAWLTGEAGIGNFTSTKPEPEDPTSRAFPIGGYVVMKSGVEHHMIVDVGPLGCSFSSGHGHADLLAIHCTAFGEPVLVDGGTYCYTPEPEWRNYFRGTLAHNTVAIDGAHQVAPDGPFQWRGRAFAHLRHWNSTAEHDFVDASHGAYEGLTHRRRVLFAKPDYWVVVDDVTAAPLSKNVKRGSDPLLLELAFQFRPMELSLVDDRWACAHTAGGNTFWVGTFAGPPVRSSVHIGEVAPIRGWISPDYGQRTPAPCLVYSTRTALPWRCITLLIPQRGVRSVPPTASLANDDILTIDLEIETHRHVIAVSDAEIFAARTWNLEPGT